MVSYAIVGASRGIGLEYVRQLAARPDAIVFAVVRNARASTHLSAAVSGLRNVHVVEADVTKHASLEAAAKQISEVTGGSLDCLIHNAARMNLKTVMLGFDDFSSMDALDEDFIDAFKINALGVVHSIAAFLPLLRASTASLKKIVVVSTSGADPKFVTATSISNMAAYGMTKAAGLMATTKWALKLKDEGFVVFSICPGLVDTTGTAADAASFDHDVLTNAATQLGKIVLQTPAQSVAAQLKIVDGLQASDNGNFMSVQSMGN